MKKVCLYIIGIVLVVGFALGLTGQLQIFPILQTLGVVHTEEDAINSIYNAFMKGQDSVIIHYYGDKEDIESFAQDLVEQVFLIDDETTSDDFDYIKNKYRGYTASISGFKIYSIHYRFDFSESYVQTKIVNDDVKKILNELNLENESEYVKVKKIHDYIIENTTYDITVKNNSAYEGLENHATACQGYANMTYKMLTEAGVQCRVITGKADNVPHAWNIVRIGELWYNLDCTWDDPIGGLNDNIGKKYSYFLKGSKNFKEHIRDAEYDTAEFNEKYKMSEKNWTKKK